MKEKYIELLTSTSRKGIGKVVDYLEKSGFFLAPASVNRHLSYDGGLVEHSVNVCQMALRLRDDAIALRPEFESRLPRESVIIAALLHDTCKSNIYRKIQKWRKDDRHNKWEQYDSYDCDYSRFPVGHGEKSVIMLLRLGLELTNDEIIAIRWHMGPWDLAMQNYEAKQNLSVAMDGCPLAAIIQAADNLATHLLESLPSSDPT